MEISTSQIMYTIDAWKQYLEEDPKAIVLSDSLGADHSRAEVDDLSDRVHSYLKKNGIGKDDVVLIHLDRGVKPVIAALGVWKAGAAFTIMESGHAKERVDFIKEDCSVKLTLDEANWKKAIASEPLREFERADDHDLALCVYTSGTTGTPKGVMHEYGQLKMEMLSEMLDGGSWREDVSTRWGLVAPLNFVASLKILVHFLYCGGHLYILDYKTVKNPEKRAAYFLRHRINETFLSPSLLRMRGGNLGPFMKVVYTGAEPANDVSLNKAELVNTYCMSESFFTVMEFSIDRPYGVAPIGKQSFDLDVRLLDEDGNPARYGETGEICFSNPYCRGYINLEEENSLRFRDGYFHTGDLATCSDGIYILKGRNDDMIKIDGNRIEPGEIENACRKTLGLKWCAAKGFEDKGVVAVYYTDDLEIDESDAREKLGKMLPYYMIPTYFIHVDEIPMTKAGKLDRAAFKLPISAYREEYVAPRTELEKKLASAMEQVLHCDRIGIHDDFFKLGGSSLLAMELLEKLDLDALGADMLYRGRTPEKIAKLYESESGSYLSETEREMIGRENRYPLTSNARVIWMYLNNGIYDFKAAYRLSPFVSLKKVRDTFNAYIKTNSTFNLVIENDDGVPVQVYREDVAPCFEIENMTEKEVKELQKTFIRPFDYGECLFRMRLIKTAIHEYVFIQLSHVVTDGAGAYLMLRDIASVFKGEEIRPAYYFAYAYDFMQPVPEEKMREAADYYARTLDPENRIRNLVKDDTGVSGKGVVKTPVTISLKKLEKILLRFNATYISFMFVAISLAQEYYNGKPSYMESVFENRSPNENIAGIHYNVGAVGITDRSGGLLELFEDLNNQQYHNIKYSYYDFDATVDYADDYSCLAISYVMDWFGDGAPIKKIGKELPLENQYANTGGRPVLNFPAHHENGNLVMPFEYDKRFLTDEHAEYFVSLVQFACDEIAEGRMPDFDKVLCCSKKE